MELTEAYFDKKFKDSEDRIIKRIDESQEDLARMVANGFEDVQKRLDVREKVQKHEKAIKIIAVSIITIKIANLNLSFFLTLIIYLT